MVDVAKAIVEARKVRRVLNARLYGTIAHGSLRGYCAIASLDLAVRIESIASLRCSRDHSHFFNQIGDTIIDITATQFYTAAYKPDNRKEPRGVLVTSENDPRWFHSEEARANVKGISALHEMRRWYEAYEVGIGFDLWTKLKPRAFALKG